MTEIYYILAIHIAIDSLFILQTQQEFFKLYLSPVDELEHVWEATTTHSVSDSVEYSDSVDWRKEGLVTSVSSLKIL